jgi:hypothetical protein
LDQYQGNGLIIVSNSPSGVKFLRLDLKVVCYSDANPDSCRWKKARTNMGVLRKKNEELESGISETKATISKTKVKRERDTSW